MPKLNKRETLLQKAIPKFFAQIRADYLIDTQIERKGNKLQFHFQDLNLSNFENVFLLGAGKCAVQMALALEELLGDSLTSGLVISENSDDVSKLKVVEFREGSHPLPNSKTVKHSKELVAYAKKANSRSLVIFLLSGGASSMFELPKEGKSIEDLIATTEDSYEEGLTIHEINRQRCKQSLVKGGGLLRFIQPATCLTIAISDVPGDSAEIIGSGPTFDPQMDPNKNMWWLIGSSKTAINVLRDLIPTKQFPVLVDDKPFTSEVKELAQYIHRNITALSKSACLIFAGESRVFGEKTGKGGRNLHLAMLLLKALEQTDCEFTIACIATDGIDGSSNLGGVIFDSSLRTNDSAKKKIDPAIKNFQSDDFWREFGTTIETGPSGSNLADVVVCIIEKD